MIQVEQDANITVYSKKMLKELYAQFPASIVDRKLGMCYVVLYLTG
jgi:hypothetical protein